MHPCLQVHAAGRTGSSAPTDACVFARVHSNLQCRAAWAGSNPAPTLIWWFGTNVATAQNVHPFSSSVSLREPPVPTPFVPAGHFPLIGGICPSRGRLWVVQYTTVPRPGKFQEGVATPSWSVRGSPRGYLVLTSSMSLAPPQAAGLAHCAARPLQIVSAPLGHNLVLFPWLSFFTPPAALPEAVRAFGALRIRVTLVFFRYAKERGAEPPSVAPRRVKTQNAPCIPHRMILFAF